MLSQVTFHVNKTYTEMQNAIEDIPFQPTIANGVTKDFSFNVFLSFILARGKLDLISKSQILDHLNKFNIDDIPSELI